MSNGVSNIKKIKVDLGTPIMSADIEEYPTVIHRIDKNNDDSKITLYDLYLTLMLGDCYYISHHINPTNDYFFYKGRITPEGQIIFAENMGSILKTPCGIDEILARWEEYIVEHLL